MRRIFAFMLALLLSCSLVSCGDYDTSGGSYNNSGYNDDAGINSVVYVSNSGKIHRNKNCSGMKYYTKMSYSEAIARGYEQCKNCY